MIRSTVVAAFVGGVMALASASALADGTTTTFSFTSSTPGGVVINDESIAVAPLFMGFPVEPTSVLTDLELEINGLSHESPMDLDIYLIDPFGNVLEIMTDRGGMFPIDNVDLIFSNKSGTSATIPENGQITSSLPRYLPEDSAGFDDVFEFAGTDAWLLLVIDDAPGQTGEFDSFTLRGVPEPATLALLAVGGMAVVMRRRR